MEGCKFDLSSALVVIEQCNVVRVVCCNTGIPFLRSSLATCNINTCCHVFGGGIVTTCYVFEHPTFHMQEERSTQMRYRRIHHGGMEPTSLSLSLSLSLSIDFDTAVNVLTLILNLLFSYQ